MPAALILTLDAAGEGCSAALLRDGVLLGEQIRPGWDGSVAALPEMVRTVLHQAGGGATGLGRIVVTVGPGSFTGVRAALSLALGIGTSAGVPVVGVTLGDAVRATMGTPGLPVWVAIDNRRGRIFLDRDGTVDTVAPGEVDPPDGPFCLAGNAADLLAAALAEAGRPATQLGPRQPGPLGIARAAETHPRPAVPLYVDPVEARPGRAARPAPHPGTA